MPRSLLSELSDSIRASALHVRNGELLHLPFRAELWRGTGQVEWQNRSLAPELPLAQGPNSRTPEPEPPSELQRVPTTVQIPPCVHSDGRHQRQGPAPLTAIQTYLRCSAKLIRVAHQLGFGWHRSPLRVTHFDTQFATDTLRIRSPGSREYESKRSQYVSCFLCEHHDAASLR